jgi:hypothetical protein
MPVARTTNKPSVVVVQKLEWSEFSPAEVRTEVVGVFPDRSPPRFPDHPRHSLIGYAHFGYSSA